MRTPGPSWPRAVASLVERCTFPPPGSDLVCAVSGGADSLALLVLGVAAGCRATAVHVDHGLREGSAAEAEIVRDAASIVGAEFRAVRVSVAAGGNLEARARAARREVLPPGAATGHTMDDQAETMLLHLLRGAATDGLAAMRAGPEHPILGLRRSETRALCEAMRLRVVVDPSNRDPRFARNRVRHELLPLCASIARRDVVPVLARQAGILAEEARFLQAAAAGVDATDVLALRRAEPVVARRALRQWLRERSGVVGAPPDLAAVQRVLTVVRGERRATEISPGLRVRRSRNRLIAESVAERNRAEQGSGSVGGR